MTRRRLFLRMGLGLWIAVSCGDRDARAGPFASTVADYDPAPGQFVNDAQFNEPTRALGPPRGGGPAAADNSSVVSLGGFGGSITLGFDHLVEDDPLNPLGLDAIIFGNAFRSGGSPQRHFAECATIQISLDENGNGLADDAWYLIPGSHIPDPAGQWLVVTWDDDVNNPTFPPDDPFWIPPGRSGMWETAIYELPAALFGTPVVVNPSADTAREGIFGYADYSPTVKLGDLDGDDVVDDAGVTPDAFYTIPDDPLRVGITPGSGGGDAFDIAWAVDPVTGRPARLPGFHFVRITSAVNVPPGRLGEKSAEVDAAADVARDPFGDVDDDGDIDLSDLAALQTCFDSATSIDSTCRRLDREPDGLVDLVDAAAMLGRLTGVIERP